MTGLLTVMMIGQGLASEVALLASFEQWQRYGWKAKAKAVGLVGLAAMLFAGGFLAGCAARLWL